MIWLEGLVRKGKVAAYKRLHAEILLKADVSDTGVNGRTGKSVKHPRGIVVGL